MEDRNTIPCSHCSKLITWPIWARIEIGQYQALCAECFDRLCRDFTANLAIAQAELIICIRQGSWQPHKIGGVR